ncbi:hypothetical protein [Nocardia paucivorans]|uniref:hypothetical protein n=1 Tax=Nocardia paucivorans TaxID=114259 RepID=UPI00030122D1|nr:hypothetical protein [Nocardia paucivorans]
MNDTTGTHGSRSDRWPTVPRGRLWVRLGDNDFLMGADEAAGLDCRIPHWFDSTGHGSIEMPSLFGKHGERIHVRTRGH